MTRRFATVNVFSAAPLDGNPVAVVLDAEGLDTDDMLAFTRWTNLSEATFLLPPTDPAADYRVRIFTQERELPFAGHPTLGTCHAWLAAGGTPADASVVVQECGAGPISIRFANGLLWFQAPPLIRDEPVSAADLARFTSVLGLSVDDVVDAHWLDNGPGWVVLMLADADAVLAVRPRPADGPLDIGLVGTHRTDHAASIEVRALFTDHLGVLREDPVTGSLNAAVAQWLFRTGRASGSYRAAQGRCVGRNGAIHLEQDERGAVWVGGAVTTVLAGDVSI